MTFRSDSSGTGSIPARVLKSESRIAWALMTVYVNSIGGTRTNDAAEGSDPVDSIEVDSFSADIFFTLFQPAADDADVIE